VTREKRAFHTQNSIVKDNFVIEEKETKNPSL
jgi:hypothetical protein